jgi:hypothetical protein
VRRTMHSRQLAAKGSTQKPTRQRVCVSANVQRNQKKPRSSIKRKEVKSNLPTIDWSNNLTKNIFRLSVVILPLLYMMYLKYFMN